MLQQKNKYLPVFYNVDDLKRIVKRAATLLGIAISEDGALEIARRSRGTPRIAGRLLRRVRDFAIVAGKKQIDAQIADTSLKQLDVDKMGLDMMDRRYLTCIAEKYNGGPVGADTLSAALSEERDTIEEVIEPYLMQEGLVQRTPRGRVLTAFGFQQIGLKAPSISPTLFDNEEQ